MNFIDKELSKVIENISIATLNTFKSVIKTSLVIFLCPNIINIKNNIIILPTNMFEITFKNIFF